MINPIEGKLGKHDTYNWIICTDYSYTANQQTTTFGFRLLCFIESKFKLYRFCATEKADAIKNKRR